MSVNKVQLQWSWISQTTVYYGKHWIRSCIL